MKEKQELQEEKTVKEKILLISNNLDIKKTGFNKFSKYPYYKPEDIMNGVIPELVKHNLFMKFSMTINPTKNCYEGILEISDFNDNSEKFLYDSREAVVMGANPAMLSGATMTYCKRYSIMNAFNIADDSEDLDSNEMAEKKEKAEKKEAVQVATQKEKNSKAHEELKKLMREKGSDAKTIPEALEDLNRFTGLKYSVFPTDEKELLLIIANLKTNGKTN